MENKEAPVISNEFELGEDETIFVKSTTNSKGLSTCIFVSAVKEQRKTLKLRGIGAGANNQMTKAVIIAKGKLTEKGISVNVDMYFKDINAPDGSGMTAIEYLLTFKN